MTHSLTLRPGEPRRSWGIQQKNDDTERAEGQRLEHGSPQSRLTSRFDVHGGPSFLTYHEAVL
jgi:hypothetical protein